MICESAYLNIIFIIDVLIFYTHFDVSNYSLIFLEGIIL